MVLILLYVDAFWCRSFMLACFALQICYLNNKAVLSCRHDAARNVPPWNDATWHDARGASAKSRAAPVWSVGARRDALRGHASFPHQPPAGPSRHPLSPNAVPVPSSAGHGQHGHATALPRPANAPR